MEHTLASQGQIDTGDKVTIITAAEVQKGDLIRVTTVDVDRTNSFQGIADHIKPSTSGRVAFRWFTADDWTLWTSASGAVIELLDRPKPKIVLPKGIGAVVEYTVNFDRYYPKRTALRALDGSWKCYNDLGEENDDYPNNKDFAEFLEADNFTHTVLFEGVAK